MQVILVQKNPPKIANPFLFPFVFLLYFLSKFSPRLFSQCFCGSAVVVMILGNLNSHLLREQDFKHLAARWNVFPQRNSLFFFCIRHFWIEMLHNSTICVWPWNFDFKKKKKILTSRLCWFIPCRGFALNVDCAPATTEPRYNVSPWQPNNKTQTGGASLQWHIVSRNSVSISAAEDQTL